MAPLPPTATVAITSLPLVPEASKPESEVTVTALSTVALACRRAVVVLPLSTPEPEPAAPKPPAPMPTRPICTTSRLSAVTSRLLA